MKRLASIQARLSWFLIAVSLAWGLSISATIWIVGRGQVVKMLDHTLLEAAEILFGLLTFDVTALPMQGPPAMPTPYVRDERLVWQVVAPDGRVELQSHRAPVEPISAQRRLGFFDAGAAWRVFGMPLRDDRRMLYVAHFGVDRRGAELQAVRATVAAVLLSALVCALWLRSRVRRELAPLKDLSASVSQYDPLQPNAQLAEPHREELVALRKAVVDFGSRLARRVANERAFTAHAAHALRTPLAGMDAQLAAALRECAPQQRARLQRTREAAGRLRSVVTALLTLFRSGVDLELRPLRVGELISRLPIDALTIEVDSDCTVNADMNLLAAAVLNLLDNSVRHGAKVVRVNALRDQGVVCIRLQDDGTGMSAEQSTKLQNALEQQDYQGHMGLGLMLADLIARAHHGRLRIVQAARGVMVEISLPDAAAG
jgi:signal transduction histidine kinase